VKIIIIVLIIICSLSDYLPAQTAASNIPPNWWLTHSIADTTTQYLYHVEVQYSYTKMTGAIEGEIQSGSGNLVIRKNIITLHTLYFLDKTRLSLKGMKYSIVSHAFTGFLDVGITRLLYFEGGFIWERDNINYILNRYTLYTGIGLNSLLYKQHYLKVLFAAGRINQDYSIPVDNIDVIKGMHWAYYINQQYRFIMNSFISFIEQAYYFNNIGYSDRYRLGVILSLNIAVIEPVSFTLGYNYKLDKESEYLGGFPTNTRQMIGLHISF
jgi:hypothetical protein